MTDATVTISVGGQTLRGFTNFSLSRGIEVVPSIFEIGVTEKFPNSMAIDIRSGEACTIQIGGNTVLNGYVGPYRSIISPDSHMVGIRGESNFGKLIRCSAVQSAPNPMYTSQPNIFGNQIINGQTVQQIATLLCKSFGISVSSTSSNASTVIPQLVYNIGDTPYQIIEKIARYAQLLVYDDLNGNVVLADVGTNSQSSGCNLPGNVSSADFTFDQNDEYSDYYVYWQNFNSTSDISSGSGFLAHGYASDTNVKMFKPLALISAQVVNGVDLGQQTANWEMKRRLGRSQILNVRLSPTSANPNPWFDSSGTLWTPNVLVPLSLPIEKVNNVSWIIARVTYGLNPQDGTYCDLQLMDPSAFSIEPTSLFPTQADIINNLQNPPYVNTSAVNSSIPSPINIPGGGT